MSGTYQEIDLDDPGKEPEDIEIVNEEVETPATPEQEQSADPPQPQQTSEEDEEGEAGDGEGGSKKRTRSQRLKAQRDHWAKLAQEAEARARAAEERAARLEQTATDSTAVGMDLLINNIDAEIKTLRADFNAAFDAGDRDKVFDIQQKLAEKAAEKKQAERERAAIPTKRAPKDQDGGATQQPTKETPNGQTSSRREPSPEAKAWFARNKDWYLKDKVATAVANAIDAEMTQEEGMDANTDPDYFEELDRRVRAALPHKFKAEERQTQTTGGKASTVVTNKGNPPASNGKVRVTITKEDRLMASHLGITIEEYAREKAKRERAINTPNQYTEI